MKRWYKALCIWVVMALALSSLAPVATAQEPQEAIAAEANYVPPRPDLPAILQRQGRLPGLGKGLDAASPQAAEAAYRQYLAQKLGTGGFKDSSVKGGGGEAKLQQVTSPPRSNILVVLVEYDDLAHNKIPYSGSQNNTDNWVSDFSESYYEKLFFGRLPDDLSLYNYILEATGGEWEIAGTVVTWTQVPSSAVAYGNDSPAGGVDNDLSDGADVYQLVRDAADTLSSFTPDAGWEDYCSDWDGESGTIDYLVIVHAGKGQEAGGGDLGDNAIWSVQGTLSTSYPIGTTGIYVKNFVVVAEDSPLGTIVHEMGHLFGLPDTWNPPYGLEVPGTRQKERANAANVGEPSPTFWDPMAYGCWLGMPLGSRPASMTAWARMRLGWLTNYRRVTLQDMPASIYLHQLATPSSPGAKAIQIDLPPRVYVTPRSGNYMQQAPDPDDMTSPSTLRHNFQITATASAELRFWHWYDLEADQDVGRVQIASPYTGSFTTVFTVTGSSNGWVQRKLDLSAYKGQTIAVRFRLPRDPYIKKLGWFLDDFELVQDGQVTWSDDGETSDLGPPQGSGNYTWQRTRFPRRGPYTSEHYYLLEWRNDREGFDRGLQDVYHMTDMAAGKAEYFRYNPGLLIWYVNPIYNRTWDNDVLLHPGEGFLLAVDSHPEPYLQSNGVPWRSRVQMQDATFRRTGTTYMKELTDSQGNRITLGGLPAVPYFLDWHSSYPYWRSSAPDNSAKTPEYGVRVEVTNENTDLSGAYVRFSIDAADMRTSRKTVDKATATPGEVLEYTIVLTNTGHADAMTIVVSDTAPADTTYIAGSYTVSGSPSWAITETVNGIRWQGTVSLTHPVTITFKVRLNPVIDNGTVVENVAYVYEGDVPEVELRARTRINSEPCLTSSRKRSDPDRVLAGDIVTYTIVLSNTGSSGGTVTLTDCMPACTSYVPGSLRVRNATQWSGGYNPQTQCITWTGYVPAQSLPVRIIFQALVSRGTAACSTISNRVTINDGFHPPFDIHENTTVISGPNLRESFKQVDKTVAAPGERLRYTIVITNTGNQDASVTMSDTIPANTSYVPGSLSCSGGNCTTNGSVVNYTATLGVGAMGVIAFSVDITQPLASGTIITNTADIVENGSKTYRREVTTTVLTEPRLTNSVKTVTTASMGYGGILTYTIRLLNDGTQDTTVYMTDAIPAHTQYITNSLSCSSGTCSYGGGQVTWTGTITRNASVTVTFAVSITLTGTGTITNCALINDSVHPPFSKCVETRIAALEVVSPTQAFYCGDLIDVPIRAVDVWDLQGYEVGVNFDPNVLQIHSIIEGSWFVPQAYFNYTYSNTAGSSLVFAALMNEPTGKTGTGILYTIRFRAVGSGQTPITITHSLLSNTPITPTGFTPIPHNRVNANVYINPRAVQGNAYLQGRTDHSGAVVEAWVGGTLVVTTTTNATGFYSLCPPTGSDQNFTIRITKRAYLPAERLVTVPPTGTLTLPDVTLLGGDPAGNNYTVTTTAPCTATHTCGGVPDGKVNVVDLSFVGARFTRQCGDQEWDWGGHSSDPDYCTPCTSNAWRADILEDCKVDIFDLVLIGLNFGRVGNSPWP